MSNVRPQNDMAIDGPGIVDSDLAHDVYNEILDLYDSGLEPEAIRDRISSYEPALVDDIQKEIYLAAAAKAFWEIGQLDPHLASRLKELLGSGKSLALWAATTDRELALKRKAVLGRLLRQIAAPRKSRRPRKKYAGVKTKLFSVGDCLSLNGLHRAVVCKIIEYRGSCEYAMLIMQPGIGDTVNSFAKGRYFGRRIPSPQGFTFGPHVIRPEHRMLVRSDNPFENVGHLELNQEKYILGSFGGVLEMKHVIDDFVRVETKAENFRMELLPLADLLKK
jgi:hypothetical protein